MSPFLHQSWRLLTAAVGICFESGEAEQLKWSNNQMFLSSVVLFLFFLLSPKSKVWYNYVSEIDLQVKNLYYTVEPHQNHEANPDTSSWLKHDLSLKWLKHCSHNSAGMLKEAGPVFLYICDGNEFNKVLQSQPWRKLSRHCKDRKRLF